MASGKKEMRYSCPCGKGEYVVKYKKDDALFEMLCPDCKEEYSYHHSPIIYDLMDTMIRELIKIEPSDIVPRGWFSKKFKHEYREKIEKFIKNVESRAGELYYAKWQNCFLNAGTEKEIWEIITSNGIYDPALDEFLKETSGFNKEEIIKKYFNYYNLNAIFDICDIKPAWDYLLADSTDLKQLILENLEKNKIKLKIEPIPPSSWGKNMRKYTTTEEWSKIRKKVHVDYNYKCAICGNEKGESELECHEVWEYDDKNHIQKLIGLVSLCQMCHGVKHITSSHKFGLSEERFIKHFMRINNCERQAFYTHKKIVFGTVVITRRPFEIRKKLDYEGERSKYKWHIDLGEYRDTKNLCV